MARRGVRDSARGGARSSFCRDINNPQSTNDYFPIQQTNMHGTPSLGSNSTDQSADSSQRVKGSNVLEQIPIDPSSRKMISLNVAGQFTSPEAIRAVTSTLKSMFNGPWSSWRNVDLINREALWQHFKELYQWEAKYTDQVIKVAWENVMKRRFSDTLKNARDESVKLAKAKSVNVSLEGNLTILKPFRPEWIRSEYWEEIIDKVWNTEKWKQKSNSAKENRNKMEYGSISKHCCGSIPISHHRDILELKLKRPPTQLELFEKTHRTKQPKEGTSNTKYITPKAGIVVNAYKDVMVARYGDDSDSRPPYDHELWIEASGGIKKGRVLGFGSVSDPERFLMPSLAAPSTSSDNLEVIMDRIREEMKEELKSEHEEMKQELLAERAKMEAQKQEIAKMYNEILKLAQGNSTN
ncbi:unnamed protein product [Lactuca virosa]|uniref:Transposase, Ptta/En/Spm, plant n=1 Tax=Lactuca virosa TaxID=75947 RepID=A0AAU9M8M6_9ASTR|nr:unnamed protein product [Lactuca virosa]